MEYWTSHPLLSATSKFPDKPALITDATTLTYSHLFQDASFIVQHLQERGFKRGDCIILDELSPIDMITMLWACSLGNYVAFPWNTRFPMATLKMIAGKVTPVAIISNRKITLPGTLAINELKQHPQGSENFDFPEFDASTPATIIMTSGSTGTVKLVTHSHLNHLSSACGSNLNIPMAAHDRWLLSLPLYHVGGLSILYRTVIAGAAAVVPSTPGSFLQNILELQVTHISLVAIQLQRLLESSDAPNILSRMKAVLLGGSAIPRQLIHDAFSQEVPIYLSYGSTEMASQITTTNNRDRSPDLAHSGRLLQDRDLIISHTGEILVKGATLALGYREGSEIIPITDSEGWFHTGDIGFLDVSGALTITGRLDNQFISGGENIQPEHIESALNRINGIELAVVIPRDDADFGARPIAFIRMAHAHPSLEIIITELKRSLPGYMIPTAFYELPDALMMGQIKISRKTLSNYYQDENKPLQPLS